LDRRGRGEKHSRALDRRADEARKQREAGVTRNERSETYSSGGPRFLLLGDKLRKRDLGEEETVSRAWFWESSRLHRARCLSPGGVRGRGLVRRDAAAGRREVSGRLKLGFARGQRSNGLQQIMETGGGGRCFWLMNKSPAVKRVGTSAQSHLFDIVKLQTVRAELSGQCGYCMCTVLYL